MVNTSHSKCTQYLLSCGVSELLLSFISIAAIHMFSELCELFLAICYFSNLFNSHLTAEKLWALHWKKRYHTKSKRVSIFSTNAKSFCDLVRNLWSSAEFHDVFYKLYGISRFPYDIPEEFWIRRKSRNLFRFHKVLFSVHWSIEYMSISAKFPTLPDILLMSYNSRYYVSIINRTSRTFSARNIATAN